MRVVTLTELRSNLGEVLDDLEAGGTIRIVRRSRPDLVLRGFLPRPDVIPHGIEPGTAPVRYDQRKIDDVLRTAFPRRTREERERV